MSRVLLIKEGIRLIHTDRPANRIAGPRDTRRAYHIPLVNITACFPIRIDYPSSKGSHELPLIIEICNI